MDKQQVVDYSVTRAALETISGDSEAIALLYCEVDIGDGKQYEQLKAVEAPIRKLRSQVESHRKELKSDSLAWGRLVDSEAKRITEALLAAEKPLKEIRLGWDDKKQAIKDEEAAQVKARLDYFTDAIQWFASEPAIWHGKSLAELELLRDQYKALVVDESWHEFMDRAAAAKVEILAKVESCIVSAQEVAAEVARNKAESERLANERAKLEAEQRKVEAELAAKRKADEDAAQAERAKLAEERAAIAAEAKAQQEAQAQREADERDRQAKVAAEEAAKHAAAEAKLQETEAERKRKAMAPDLEKIAVFLKDLDAFYQANAPEVGADGSAKLDNWADEIAGWMTVIAGLRE